MTRAFSLGMTKLTQLPWPQRLATPCLSLPPMYTWAFCARRRGQRTALRGWSSAPAPSAAPPQLCAWGRLMTQPVSPAPAPSWHQSPGLAQAVCALFTGSCLRSCSGEPPTSTPFPY